MVKKVVSIGECMVQMLQRPDGLYERNYAGDSQNFIQYLAWIGKPKNIQAFYLTVMGKDKFGHDIIQQWQDEGIQTSLVMTTDKKNTGLYFADTDENGHRDYTYYRSDAAARMLFDLPESNAIIERSLDTDILYASAISMMILSDYNKEKLIDLFAKAKAKGIKTAFDTNYRPSGWLSPDNAAYWMNKIFPYIEICLPTNDENQSVFGDKSDEETIARLQSHGIPEVVVKCGEKGALIGVHEENIVHISALPAIKVLDTTSAGDSFNAAYIYGRLMGLPPSEAAKWGNRLAAEVIQHRGAFIPRDNLPDFEC